MFEDANYFWKNFRLGTELHVSGSFIYNALFTLHNINNFCYEDECFDFLYNAAVGIERLEKVVIILLEHNEKTNQVEFEKTLISHNHVELIKRIEKSHDLQLGKVRMKFLQLLSNFYKTIRYERYGRNSGSILIPCW